MLPTPSSTGEERCCHPFRKLLNAQQLWRALERGRKPRPSLLQTCSLSSVQFRTGFLLGQAEPIIFSSKLFSMRDAETAFLAVIGKVRVEFLKGFQVLRIDWGKYRKLTLTIIKMQLEGKRSNEFPRPLKPASVKKQHPETLAQSPRRTRLCRPLYSHLLSWHP